MSVSRAAGMAAVLGGLVWLVAAALDWGRDVNPVVYTVGLVWFLVASMGLGYGLVDKAPVWLRAVVSVATPLLGYGVWFTISDAFTARSRPRRRCAAGARRVDDTRGIGVAPAAVCDMEVCP